MPVNHAAYVQLAAVGKIGEFLIDPDTSVIFVKYQKASHFAFDYVSHHIHHSHFGGKSDVTITRGADLLGFSYVEIELPAIAPMKLKANQMSKFPPSGCNGTDADVFALAEYGSKEMQKKVREGVAVPPAMVEEAKLAMAKASSGYGTAGCQMATECPVCGDDADTYVHWANDIGRVLLQKVDLKVSGTHLCEETSESMLIYEELCGNPNKSLNEMTGRCTSLNALVCFSQSNQLLQVPLPFWFSMGGAGFWMPLASMPFSSVEVAIAWRPLEQCICVSNEKVAPMLARTGDQVAKDDLSARLICQQIVLPQEEHNVVSTADWSYPVEYNTTYTVSHVSEPSKKIHLGFNLVSKFFAFAIRRESNELTNNWFNFSSVLGADPLKSFKLHLNHISRTDSMPATFARLVVPYVHMAKPVSVFVYAYPFAQSCHDMSIYTGGLNCSKLDHISLDLEMEPSLFKGGGKCTIIVLSRVTNILVHQGGVTGFKYSA